MVAQHSLTEESLYRFLEEHGNSRVKRQLLLFWGMHPNAKFSMLALRCAVECSKLDMKMALRSMIEVGLLDTHIYNDVPLYSLSRNEEKRRPVLELAALGWNQRLLMHKRMEQKINQLALATNSL
jgi:hypothetical protein